MSASGEPVRENQCTDEEERQKELDGQNGNQESDETEEVKTEEEEHRQKESQDEENDEIQEGNPSGYVVIVEEEDDEEEERRRRAAEKGKQSMPDQGGITITEINDEDDEDDTDYHLDLAILRAISDYKCTTRNSPHPPSYNNQLLFVKNSFPDLKFSREDLEEKITALEKRFNDVRKQHGDHPELVQPMDREIFNMSMRLWGRRY